MKKIGVLGGRFGFEAFLHCCGMKTIRYFSAKDAVNDAVSRKISALFLLPSYEQGEELLPTFDNGTVEQLYLLREKGFPVYTENYCASQYITAYLFGMETRRKPEYFCQEYLISQENELYQKRNGWYFITKPRGAVPAEVLLSVVDCVGTHTPIFQSDAPISSVLVKYGSFLTAFTALTDYDGSFMLPFFRWKALFGKVFGAFLQIDAEKAEKAFEEAFEESKLAFSYNKSLKDTVMRAVEWHFASGMMPNDFGTEGVYEMVESYRYEIFQNIRVDANLFTSVLFITAGLHFNRPEWVTSGEGIARFIIDKMHCQLEGGPNDGLMEWFCGYHGGGVNTVWSSDSGRSGLNILRLYELTLDHRLLQRAVALGEGFLRWFGGEAMLPTAYFCRDTDDIQKLSVLPHEYNYPECYESVCIFLGKLYHMTKDRRYLAQLEKTVQGFMKIYPNFGKDGASHSANFTNSRFLGMLAAAYLYSGKKKQYVDLINELLEKFARLQHPMGGFAEENAYIDGWQRKNIEFSISFGGKYDCIADTMYCCNTMLTALLLLEKAKFPNDAIREMREDITKFYMDTQIKSKNPKFNGAWMRAVDMEHGEYYGCHRDAAWGPYCIIGGWVMGAVPLMMLEMLGEGSFYY